MHRSVLQNKKYIKFAEKNSVEVMAISGAQKAVKEGHAKAGTYKAKNAAGEEVEYLLEFPGMTAAQLDKLARSGASKYNERGIPNTTIVNPHNLEAMTAFKGSQAAGYVMDEVTKARKVLTASYGKGIARKKYRKIRETQDQIKKDAADGNFAKAVGDVMKLEKSTVKFATVHTMIVAFRGEIVGMAGKHLDELEALIGRGEKKAAAKELGPLTRALKGTDLEARAAELLAKAKAKAE